MPKPQILGAISVVTILSLTIFTQTCFGQTPTLDKLNLENSQSPQCLDFNQDKICEYILLANGTMVRNPDISSSSSTGSPNLNSFVTGIAQPSSTTGGQCLGAGYNYCKNLLMPDGRVVSNPNFVEPTYEELGTGSSSGSGSSTTQAQTGGVEENDDDSNEVDNDNDGLDDSERNDEIGEDLPQEGGCQDDDDYCDADEGCRSDNVDCIDDREFDEDDYNG